MFSRRETLAAPLLLGVASSAVAAAPSTGHVDFLRFVRSIMAANNVPGFAIALVQDGRLALAEGFGLRSIESSDKVDADTVFRVGSIAKPFTALTMLRLVDTGRVKLDERASKYLPALQATSEITIAQLLSHTAGLADFRSSPLSKVLSKGQLPTMSLYAVQPIQLAWEPGRWVSYSNPSFSLAGAVIEAVTGNRFEVEAQKTIDKIGMPRATFDVGRVITYPHSVSHTLRGGKLTVIRPEPLDDYRVDTAAGMMFASARDLGRFAEWLIARPGASGAVSEAAFQQMKTPRGHLPPIRYSYGLGLWIRGDRDEQVIGHRGNIPGNSATVFAVPSRGFGIAVLTNTDGAGFVEEILQAALEKYAGLPGAQDVHTPHSPEHAGTYEQVGLDGVARRREVFFNSAGEIATRSTNGPAEGFGQPVRPDVYRRAGSYLVFLRDVSTRVVGLNLGSRHWAKVA